MTDGSALVPVSPYGPFIELALTVHELAGNGRFAEAIAAANEFQAIARAFGDEKTVDFLIQGRMFAHQYHGDFAGAMAVGLGLLDRQRAAGNVLGEAKTLADLAQLGVQSNRTAQGILHLARAGLLLETTSRRNERYASALAAYGQAANTAGLYEVAAAAYEQVLAEHAAYASSPGSYLAHRYLELLLTWGFRLDHLGHGLEAGFRLRRAVAVASGWLAEHPGTGPDGAPGPVDTWEIRAVLALARAKLGEAGEATALAAPLVLPLREHRLAGGAWAVHLALGIAHRRLGDHPAARRELLAARDWCGLGGWADDELIVAHELAVLAAQADGGPAARDLLAALDVQNRLLGRQRMQQLTALHHARDREELALERAGTQAALLRDPLTGLGNRRQFDQLMTELDTGAAAGPVSLLILDVDKFKAVNDTYSHTAGDALLRRIGAVLAACCRTGQDVPIRYAGDEFTIFCYADLPAAVEVAERIRAAVAGAEVDGIAPGAPVSVSIGVAARADGMTAAELFQAADANLYRAKRGGRNRVAASAAD
ncbi:GGDEF domain-containing protein [Jidongwangia harbinensis]|uniref:GGDEF domain-containing protein n=1 Tax=Jidongwangia harbinensis TaxID=2878561 RepID=UPI001CD91C42|nr:GGDEF domain-containing protein [Jidongwangia harbinensis]MCA2212071.1 GGDEF domain-containing protein [Jidongwangia harbinensis]